jgi:hypothetical protein
MALQNDLAPSDLPPTNQPCAYAEIASQPLNPRLQAAQLVYLKRGGSGPPLAHFYAGPYRVVQYFVIQVGGRHETVMADRLKPHPGTS